MPSRWPYCARLWVTEQRRPRVFEQLPLRDIHLPDPVSWWPPALGWWLVAALLLLLAVLAYRLPRRARAARRRRHLRQEALGELDAIERRLAERGDPAGALESVSVLLRRVAVTVFDGQAPAGISGREWVDWLLRHGPTDVDTHALRSLVDAPYRPRPDVDATPVIRAARHWMAHASRRPEAGS